jgi:hypothetical protein
LKTPPEEKTPPEDALGIMEYWISGIMGSNPNPPAFHYSSVPTFQLSV